jgi:hypothetical protein
MAGSHLKMGWHALTCEIIEAISTVHSHVVFVLWGAKAQAHVPFIDQKRHTLVLSAHPSPLSAYQGFFGSKPFSRCNEALQNPSAIADRVDALTITTQQLAIFCDNMRVHALQGWHTVPICASANNSQKTLTGVCACDSKETDNG